MSTMRWPKGGPLGPDLARPAQTRMDRRVLAASWSKGEALSVSLGGGLALATG